MTIAESAPPGKERKPRTIITDRSEFPLLVARHKSNKEIAKIYGVTTTTISNWKAEFKDTIDEETARLDKIKWEGLRQRYMMAAEHKVEMFGKILLEIKDSLGDVKWDKVTVSKRVELLLALAETIKDSDPESKAEASMESWRSVDMLFARITKERNSEDVITCLPVEID